MNSNNDQKLPEIRNKQIKYLKKLSNISGVSGDESRVREFILDTLEPFTDDMKVDALGNVLLTKIGSAENRLRVMVAAHMDEVGLMITDDAGKGIFRFDIVGGIDERQLPGKAVLVGENRIPGVIGAKPIHFTTVSERSKNLKSDSLRVDVGEENAGKLKTGDRAVFATKCSTNQGTIFGKALDDRIGVASLIELVKNPPENIDLLAAFTVQEEIGLRGAGVAAFAMRPDAAIVLDCTPANDLPVWDSDGGRIENTRYNARLDQGPAIYVADRATLSDPRLIAHIVETAESHGIPYQYRQPGSGGTDAGAIHKQLAGIPSISISVPGRYLHTAISIARIADWEHTLQLVYLSLAKISAQVISQER
jgi:endoglucanase